MGRKRPIELKFRLSEDEYKMLQSKLEDAGINRNAFLVRLISDAKIFPREEMIRMNTECAIANRLLRGIGININQIAKIANTNKATPSAKLLLDMYQDVQTLKHNLLPLWDEVRREWRF